MIRARRLARVSLLVVVAAFAASQASAALFSADAVKAAFLYRFASYIEWPEDAVSEGPFVIAVYGAEDVAKQLDVLLPKMTVHGRAAEVRRVTRVSDLEGAHIFYVGPAQSLARSRALREAAIVRPILLVTDDEHGLDAGGIINFIDVERNVRFDVSLAAADRARLKIAAALLAVAAHVERRPQASTNCMDPYLHPACAIRVASADLGTRQ